MMPSAKQVAPLGHLTTLISSGSTPKGGSEIYLEAGPEMLIRSQNMRMNELTLDDVAYVTDEIDSGMNRSRVRHGDVLLNITGASIGRVAAFELENIRANVNQHVCIVRPKPDVLITRYLTHLICSPEFQAEIDRLQHGGTRQALTFGQIAAFKIPLPPLAEQRRIAAILDQADSLRAKRRAALAELNTLTQSLFLDLFGDPAANPKGWPACQLQEVVRTGTIVTYGIVQAGEECPDGVPYIRTGDIVDGEIASAGLRHTDPTIAARFLRSRVETGDIVMSIRATVGTTALVPPRLDGANLTQGTAKISPGENTNPLYLLSLLRASGTQHWISLQIKGATFREITLTRLRELPVTLPPSPSSANSPAASPPSKNSKPPTAPTWPNWTPSSPPSSTAPSKENFCDKPTRRDCYLLPL